MNTRKSHFHSAKVRTAFIALFGLTVPVAACSDGASSQAEGNSPASLPTESAEHSVHILVGAPGQWESVELGPIVGNLSPKILESTTPVNGLQPTNLVETPDGAAKTADPFQNGGASTAKGWALLAGAAAQCGLLADTAHGHPLLQANPQLPPWSAPSGVFIFPGPSNCDEILAEEETLVCIADRLLEVAEAIGPVTWENTAYLSISGVPTGPWTFPPQPHRDRFILRDLAAYALSTIPYLEEYALSPPGVQLWNNCTDWYAKSAASETFASTYSNAWYHDPSPLAYHFYPREQLQTGSQKRAAAKERLNYKAHILRAASRMLPDIIRTSVFADIAGAEWRRAAATDLIRGSQSAWAAVDNDSGYYSLAHAVRIVAGRWEASPYLPDPAYKGVTAARLLPEAYGRDFSARVSDRAATTSGQTKATKIADSEGIAIRPQEVPDAAALRAAVRDQLLRSNAWRTSALTEQSDPTKYAAFVAGPSGQAISDVVDKLTDQDIQFGIDRAFEHYRLLTSSDELGHSELGGSFPAAPLEAAEIISPLVLSLGGTVIKGGMPRADLSVDFFARAGRILTASQSEENCAEEAFSYWYCFGSFTQDLFLLGQTLSREMVALREAAKSPNVDLVGKEDAAEVADRAIAESRAWAGKGMLGLYYRYDTNTADLYIAGLTPSDLGYSDATQLGSNLLLTVGQPWKADCAAGLRKSCPASVQPYAVAATSNSPVVIVPQTAAELATAGLDGPVLKYTFELCPSCDEGAFYDEPITVVLKRDPANPAQGKVLGSLNAEQILSVAAISDMQKELIQKILGFSHEWAMSPSELGQLPSSVQVGSCIDGVPRNLFVPLENELTSDGDQYESSWKHYLTIAATAAENADMLGQKLIELGTQTDMRREAAGEELAEQCGSYSALDEIGVSNGKMMPPGSDSALASCFSEDKIDFLFLGTDNPKKNQTEKLDYVRTTILQCVSNDSRPECTNNDLVIEFMGLAGLDEEGVGATSCDKAVSTHLSLMTGLRGDMFSELGLDDFTKAETLATTAAQLRMESSSHGAWTLYASSKAIMDSSVNSHTWPGCLRVSFDDCTDKTSTKILDQTFRRGGMNAQGEPLLLGHGPDGDGTADAANKEANLLRWRVEGAIVMLGSLARTSVKLIERVPAANFSDSNQVEPPYWTVYGKSLFSDATSTWELVDDGEKNKQALHSKIHTDTFPQPFPETDEIPEWLREVYRQEQGYFGIDAERELAPYSGFDFYWMAKDVYGWMVLDLDGAKCLTVDGKIRYIGNADPAPPNKKGTIENLMKRSGPFLTDNMLDGSLEKTFHHLAYTDGVPVSRFWDFYFSSPCDGGVYVNYDIKNTGFSTNCAMYDVVDAHQTHEIAGMAFPDLFSGYCQHLRIRGMNRVTAECAASNRYGSFMVDDTQYFWSQYTHDALTAMNWSPDDRLPVFANTMRETIQGDCDEIARLTQATVLACVLKNGMVPSELASPPTDIQSVDDLAQLEGFMAYQRRQAVSALNKLYLRSVPRRVKDSYDAGIVDAGLTGGEHGKYVLEMQKGLISMNGAWLRVIPELDIMRANLAAARAEIRIAVNAGKVALSEMHLAELKLYETIATEVASGIESLVSLNFVGAANTAEQIAFDLLELDNLQMKQEATKETTTDQVTIAINNLYKANVASTTIMREALLDVRTAVASIEESRVGLDQSEQKAQYEAAKASGADYYVSPDGKKVTMPVNTAMRRQYDVTSIRYKRAVEDAKRFAYIARLAIEQRIGQRLNTITTPVGGLDAPATWADDVCRITGIDYEKYRTATLPSADGGPGIMSETLHMLVETNVIQGLADQYVGDYVRKLQQFVEYYNIQYPSHEGDDLAVLSLRDELLSVAGPCVVDSPNLLYYSGTLERYDISGDDPARRIVGWEARNCFQNDTACIEVLPGATLPEYGDPPASGVRAGLTWLHEIAPPTGLPNGSATLPQRSVAQRVWVPASGNRSVVLSWFDQARTDSGQIPDADPGVEYRVSIFDENWAPLTSHTGLPYVRASASASVWDVERKHIDFTMGSSGYVWVVVFPSANGSKLGSLAIANMQLEIRDNGDEPGAYVGTGSSRQYVSSECTNRSATDFQKAFVRGCDSKNVCYYELRQPVRIDTKALNENSSSLSGKIAADNFNFRHISLALNVVGTGVIDCSANPSASCYGSGYVEYSLDHTAFSTGVIGYTGQQQFFNFGSASINHGKALAAERYITVPVSAADLGLITEDGVGKVEFSGRPLDGAYRLRIYDSPSLVWNRVEDVQFVLKYRYWSAIQGSN